MMHVGNRTLGNGVQAEAAGFCDGYFRFAVSRVTGDSHQRKREVCDDYWAISGGEGLAAVVLADGAGSAALAQEGAQTAATVLAERLSSPRYQAVLAAGSVEDFRAQIVSDDQDHIPGSGHGRGEEGEDLDEEKETEVHGKNESSSGGDGIPSMIYHLIVQACSLI